MAKTNQRTVAIASQDASLIASHTSHASRILAVADAVTDTERTRSAAVLARTTNIARVVMGTERSRPDAGRSPDARLDHQQR